MMYKIFISLLTMIMLFDVSVRIPQNLNFHLQNKKTVPHPTLTGQYPKQVGPGISSLVVALVSGAVIYATYRSSRYRNSRVRSNQCKFTRQQKELKALSLANGKLVTANNWLLREVHHRVKNNLQIVMSLLNSQTSYLKNEVAIEAITDSRNRIQAISLLHQQLYGSNSISNIDMAAYIADLVLCLSDCYDTQKKHIAFELTIDPVNICSGQAITVGLILNEAITNAIKYAFGDKAGKIIIGLQLTQDNEVLLTLSYNGKGLIPNFELKRSSTLGMEMIKALCNQLKGEFKTTSGDDSLMCVTFKLDKAAEDPASLHLFTKSI